MTVYSGGRDAYGPQDRHGGTIFTLRGLVNIGCLFILVLGVLTLFAGYPIISHYTDNRLSTNGAYNIGGINSTGQVPLITNFPSLIDSDTPDDAMTRTGFDGNQWELVFSDEFNKDGRTFFDGDDPFWTAVGESFVRAILTELASDTASLRFALLTS